MHPHVFMQQSVIGSKTMKRCTSVMFDLSFRVWPKCASSRTLTVSTHELDNLSPTRKDMITFNGLRAEAACEVVLRTWKWRYTQSTHDGYELEKSPSYRLAARNWTGTWLKYSTDFVFLGVKSSETLPDWEISVIWHIYHCNMHFAVFWLERLPLPQLHFLSHAYRKGC